jgi:hypothetical protein
MLVIAGLAAFIPAPVFAQSNDLIKQEDYYPCPFRKFDPSGFAA